MSPHGRKAQRRQCGGQGVTKSTSPATASSTGKGPRTRPGIFSQMTRTLGHPLNVVSQNLSPQYRLGSSLGLASSPKKRGPKNIPESRASSLGRVPVLPRFPATLPGGFRGRKAQLGEAGPCSFCLVAARGHMRGQQCPGSQQSPCFCANKTQLSGNSAGLNKQVVAGGAPRSRHMAGSQVIMGSRLESQ